MLVYIISVRQANFKNSGARWQLAGPYCSMNNLMDMRAIIKAGKPNYLYYLASKHF